jgi:hypothetical protein
MVFQEGFRNNLDEISETKGLNESGPGILVLHLEVSVQMGFLARINLMTKKEQSQIETSDQTWVLSSLEHDQLANAKKHPIPRRHLKGPELAVLWALRIYLLFMMAVVAYQVWIAAR